MRGYGATQPSAASFGFADFVISLPLHVRLDVASALAAECAALDALAAVDEETVRPIFIKTTAIGSLMRRKIEPIVTPLLAQIAVLRKAP